MILRFDFNKRASVARFLLIGLSLSVAACSSDADGGGGMQITPAETVEDALDNFQIDTAQSPRLDSDGDPLPDDYAPFGSSAAIERFAELALLGFETDLVAGSKLSIVKERPDQNNNFDAVLLHSVPETETSTAMASKSSRSSITSSTSRSSRRGAAPKDGASPWSWAA